MTLQRLSCGSLETIKVAAELGALVTLNQCLFGYDDGHRLLSASQKLSEDAASLLLMHSDLVPGLNAGRTDGYWTGIPVPSAKAYALMRTWPAPEMPRPGCVWTHVILIPLADMARFPDLAVVGSLFARPSLTAGYSAYASALTIDPVDAGAAPRPVLSQQNAVRVLRALYAPRSSGILLDDGEAIDAAIFAVWSQQWPRLRRAFSFRTAGLAADPSKTRFDLRIVREPLSSIPPGQTEEPGRLTDWEQVAIDDLLAPSASAFRRFLWRYGSDIRRGRERYRFLAQLFLGTGSPVLSKSNLTGTLDKVVDALPEADDGKLLKEDLLACGRSTYSLLPAADPIDTLGYFIGHPDLTALPPPPANSFEAIQGLWPKRASEILTIAEEASGESSSIVEQLLDRLAGVVEPTNFLGLSREYPTVRERLIRANPALLDSPDLTALPGRELLDFLAILPDDQDLAARVLDRLLFSDNRDVAAFFAERFLKVTEDRIFDALVSELTVSGSRMPRVWPDVVRQRSLALTAHMLDRATTTTALGALAGWLGLDVAAGLKASPAAWGAALLRVEDDIREQPRQRLLAYFLALALARPGPGCEPLFEIAFESVHGDIAVSRLPYDAFEALSRFLPDLSWWQQWDTCRRLRLAVVEAFVNADLDPRSFRRLTGETALFDKLMALASETKPGRRLLKRALDEG